MFDLMTPSTYPLQVSYITDYGQVRHLAGQIECFINTQSEQKATWKKHVEWFNRSICLVRGYSKYKSAVQSELITDVFTIKTDNNLSLITPLMSYLGNLIEIAPESLKMMMCDTQVNLGNSFSNCYTKYLYDDSYYTTCFITKDGIKKHSFLIEFVFADNYNPDCPTCKSALSSLKDILSIFNKSFFYDEKELGKDLFISGNDCISLGYDYDNPMQAIKTNLMNDFAVILHDAKIKDLKLIELT